MLNTAKPYTTIYSADPAIDTARMTEAEMLAYLHDRDATKLKIKQGERAAVYHLRPISHERLAEIVDTCATDGARFIRSFRASVIRVEHLRLEDGLAHTWAPADVDAGLNVEEARLFSMSVILDVGSVAWLRSFLGPANVRRFAPLPLLLGHLAALPYQSAEPSEARPNKSADNTTAASTDHGEAKRAEHYASPIAASATAEASSPVG